MQEFLDGFNSEMLGLMLNQKTMNVIYKSCIGSVRTMKKFNEYLIHADNGMDSAQSLDMSTSFVCHKLFEYSTNFKRCKMYESSERYVSPQQMALGIRWENERNELITTPSLVQCKFQYVSISKTIVSIFQRPDFREVYLKFNESNEKKAVPGVYSDFSSGSIFKANDLFQTHPNSLQIQIATDDFEVCNPLGSKSTLHKISAFYFSIRNMPPEFRSKLDNIYLVALCNADDLKTKFTDFNDIWRIVVKDLSALENGIDVGGGLTITGTLVNIVADNLGANIALGFVANFSKAKFYCRFCECDIIECKAVHVDIPSKRRTKQRYNNQIITIANSESVDSKDAQGVQRYCELNNLKYFHMLDNMSPDIMHDLNEGIIPFLLKHLFAYCVSKKVLSEAELKTKIQYDDYGFKNRKNCPSLVSLEKGNLNQNATQTLCLLQHIPFILHGYCNNDKIKEVWDCVKALLRITQISYSSKIDEGELCELENNIRIHLECIKKHFKVELIPKHHFVTHYPAVIRAMGTLNAMSAIRFESKHKSLKAFAGETNNFINLTKTLATKHQQMISGVEKSYTNEFARGKLMKFTGVFLEDHAELLRLHFNDVEDLFETSWLEHNIFTYRKGLFVSENKVIREIVKIVLSESEFYLICIQFDFNEVDEFLNSIKITKSRPEKYTVIKFNDLKNKKTYEKKNLGEETYIILDTLDFINIGI